MKKTVSLLLASAILFGCTALEPYIKQETDSTEDTEKTEDTKESESSQTDKESGKDVQEDDLITYKMHGVAQKGQLLRGSLVTGYGMGEDMEATDECFHSQVTDDMGSFVLSSKTSASYLEINVNGYYFVENTGEISEAPIYLQAIVPNGTENFSINVLTTIITPRVKYLISKGKSYEEATSQAEDELMQAIGYTGQEYKSFSQMNITGGSYSDAVLLAASCLVQEDRSTAEVQAIISDLASVLEKNGTVSVELVEQLFEDADEIDIWYITENISEYYKHKNIKDYNIPPFYLVLDESYAKGVHLIYGDVVYPDYSGCNVGKNGTTNSEIVLCAENFNVVSNCNWIKVEKSRLIADFYEITYTIEANEGDIRSGKIQYMIGSEIVAESDFRQQGNGIKLYIELPNSGTKTLVDIDLGPQLQVGEEVNINGKIYKLLKDDIGFYADIREQASMYSVCYPVSSVYEDLDGNKVPFTPVQNSNDYYYCSVTYPTTGYPDNVRPYFGLIQGMEGMSMIRVKLTPCYAGLKIEFRDAEIKNKTISISADQNLFGKFTYSPYLNYSELMYNPNAVLREPVVSNGTKNAVVKLDDNYSSKVLYIAPRNYNFQEFGLDLEKIRVDFDCVIKGKEITKSIEINSLTSLFTREGYTVCLHIKLDTNGEETYDITLYQ